MKFIIFSSIAAAQQAFYDINTPQLMNLVAMPNNAVQMKKPTNIMNLYR